MNVLKKALTASTLATAFLASTSLFANTTVQTSANVQAQTAQPNMMQSLKHNTQHAAHSTSQAVGQGIDKTKAASKEKWQDTKNFTAEKSNAVKNEVHDVKQAMSTKTQQGDATTQQKMQHTRHATDSSKGVAVNGQSQLHLDTPVAKAKVGSTAHASAGSN